MHDGHLEPVDRFDWERVVRATDTTSTVKLVALMLATYGDRSGRKLRPGVERLAKSCGLSQRATRAALGTLRDLGLTERTVIGKSTGRRAMTDEHRLTRPAGVPADSAGTDPVDNPEVPATGAGTFGGSTGTSRQEYRHLTTEVPAPDDRSTGTTCTPSDLYQISIKSSSEAGDEKADDRLTVAGSDDDLASKIARTKSWPLPHARRVVKDILDRAPDDLRSPERYVLRAIENDHAGQYAPAPGRETRLPPGCGDCDHGWIENDHGVTSKCPACFRAHAPALYVEGWS